MEKLLNVVRGYEECVKYIDINAAGPITALRILFPTAFLTALYNPSQVMCFLDKYTSFTLKRKMCNQFKIVAFLNFTQDSHELHPKQINVAFSVKLRD
ncbi:hypothetical protein NQ317_011860 [Molorchus minor]|uniref:Uncharacterized protein n=1 Tax=Molorchus minor TaxID=1323400 RepID=A0ABQ9JLW1_9CUCU|nr:hypothetical protein NQ317_011860 [Molorchus minor]